MRRASSHHEHTSVNDIGELLADKPIDFELPRSETCRDLIDAAS